MQRATQPVRILLVEDNAGDVELTRLAIEEAGLESEVVVAGDGLEALARLRSEVLPTIVLLDINIPHLDGLQVLREIKSDPLLRRTPVFMYSGSSVAGDVERSYELGANGFLPKAPDYPHLLENMRRLKSFWFATAVLPSA